MKLYKLTDEKGYTKNNTLWGVGVTHKVNDCLEPILCTSGVIHAYTSPLLAALLNPIHTDFINPLLWEAEGEVVVKDATKVGCKRLTTISTIELPKIAIISRVAFGILCAKKVSNSRRWNIWAKKWLSGEDRSSNAAYAAGAADAAAYAAYATSAAKAAYASDAAARAATYTAYAADAAVSAAYAAAYAAADAAINLEYIAKQAMTYQ